MELREMVRDIGSYCEEHSEEITTTQNIVKTQKHKALTVSILWVYWTPIEQWVVSINHQRRYSLHKLLAPCMISINWSHQDEPVGSVYSGVTNATILGPLSPRWDTPHLFGNIYDSSRALCTYIWVQICPGKLVGWRMKDSKPMEWRKSE